MNIFIVTPVYNEEKRIESFVKDIKKVKTPVVLVDDGSSDTTLLKLRSASTTKQITVLTHKINLGKGAALKTGCEYAFTHGADAVILMDSDGQHSAADIEKFVKKLNKKECDVILGSRNLSMGVPLDRYLGNKIASIFVSLMFDIYVSDLICGFRALTKKAYKKINWESLGYGVETEMVVKMKKYGLTYCEVPVDTIYFESFKGASINDAFGILFNLLKWRLTL